ncbi:MAG: VOC family protein [Congregibacter sp.]
MPELNTGVSALIRATIFVRNLEKSRDFYKALGLTETYFDGVLEHPSASALLGFNQHVDYPISILKVAGPNFGMLGLFELSDTAKVEQQPIASGSVKVGEVALIFYVASLTDVLPKLEVLGGVCLTKPIVFELGEISQREVCLRDIDGTLINLVERPPNMQFLSGMET